MIEFGKTLREAREAKGYSVSQLAETTHILSRIIDDLEHEDFSKIVAPIYGRGFVKLYCEAVGLEPKPFVAEFMDIYSGNRPPAMGLCAKRDEAIAPTAERKPEPPPACEPMPEPSPEPPPRMEDRPSFATPEPPPMPPRRDYRMTDYSLPEVPRSFWRFGILGVAAIAILVLIVIGCRALYKKTMTPPTAAAQATTTATSQKAAPRTPIEIPPLYID